MWDINLPLEVKYLFTENEKLSEKEYKIKERLLGEPMKKYIQEHTYDEYINLPYFKGLLEKHFELEPIVYACFQCQKYNFAKRTGNTKNGTKEEQLTGIIAQTVLSDYLGLPRPDGSQGFDNGKDLVSKGANIDIKCMGRGCFMEHQWVHNLIKSQLDNELSDTDYYLFCSLNKQKAVLQVCGYVQKRFIPDCAKLWKEGDVRYRDNGKPFTLKADTFEIYQDVLYPINEKQDLGRMNKENLEAKIGDDFVDDCVKWFKLMEDALNGDEKAINELTEREEERFEKILAVSTTSDYTHDIFTIKNREKSLDDIMRLVKHNKIRKEINNSDSHEKYRSVLTNIYNNNKQQNIEKQKQNTKRNYYER